MYAQILSLLVLVGALGSLTPNAAAQAADFISLINGQTLENSGTDRYFNRRDCGLDPEQGTGGTGGTGGSETDGGVGGVGGDGGAGGIGGASAASALKAGPEDTTFEIRLQNTGTAIGDVWLWTGAAGAECQLLNQRQLENAGLCAELAGNPRPAGLNDTLTGLTLQDLIDAKAGSSDIVQCDSSGLTGTPYQIFVFRGAPSNDVPPENYGVAPLTSTWSLQPRPWSTQPPKKHRRSSSTGPIRTHPTISTNGKHGTRTAMTHRPR